MLSCLVDEEIVARKLGALEGEPMVEFQAALDSVMAADIDALLQEAISIEDDEEAARARRRRGPKAQCRRSAAETIAPKTQPTKDPQKQDVLLDAFGQPIPQETMEPAVAGVAIAEAGGCRTSTRCAAKQRRSRARIALAAGSSKQKKTRLGSSWIAARARNNGARTVRSGVSWFWTRRAAKSSPNGDARDGAAVGTRKLGKITTISAVSRHPKGAPSGQQASSATQLRDMS